MPPRHATISRPSHARPWALLLLLAFACCFPPIGRAADEKAAPEPTGYTEVEYRMLKASIETYANKKVSYEGRFLEFSATFPTYIEESGFKANRYFLLVVQDTTVFVMAKKSDEMNTLVGGLQRGQQVKIYGRVKKFRREPEKSMMPRYYVELEELRLVEDAADATPTRGGKFRNR